MDFGEGRDEEGRVATDPQIADRLLLVETIVAEDWCVVLPRVIAIKSGTAYWIVGSSLHLRSEDGEVKVIDGKDSYWLCR
ncbi:hypothetical protein CS0771_11120 [Catellatospora sp. IY07-71]|uniref:hypothetical protein n=1 Tax=Catellatospora sp. IY07-71 TaxID=2728827 RepID=UPI001BB344D3|nr:hypothetical protein [Catellatospora sp. IY07-71]BCJ71568.1 hypothetical protein CS0771_11120 [Catellatospora sp. IY07-71]